MGILLIAMPGYMSISVVNCAGASYSPFIAANYECPLSILHHFLSNLDQQKCCYIIDLVMLMLFIIKPIELFRLEL